MPIVENKDYNVKTIIGIILSFEKSELEAISDKVKMWIARLNGQGKDWNWQQCGTTKDPLFNSKRLEQACSCSLHPQIA